MFWLRWLHRSTLKTRAPARALRTECKAYMLSTGCTFHNSSHLHQMEESRLAIPTICTAQDLCLGIRARHYLWIFCSEFNTIAHMSSTLEG